MLLAINKYILVEDIEEHGETKTTGGIVIPSGNADRKAYYGIYGRVYSVSQMCDSKLAKQIKKGDRILFNKHEAIPFRYEGTDYQAILDHWVIALENK